jgi:hypothetical protein
MRDNRNKYNDRWYEDGPKYRYRHRRSLRHFNRDLCRLIAA